MGFRTLEISHAAEIHIKEGQLEITTDDGVAVVPIDDLIEPYRAIVDLVAHNNIASNIQLTKSERREFAHVLHNACIVDGVKVNVMSAIDIMVESLKRIILDASTEKLKLPMILPIESMEGITE